MDREAWRAAVHSWAHWEDLLEEGTASHSSTLAWRRPWTEEPGGLQSTAGHSCSDYAAAGTRHQAL